MKRAFFPAAAIVAGVAAQDLSSLPQCGQTCVNNLIAEGPNLGCTQATAVCLCASPNFAWGIHDCSAESCPSGTNLQEINQYGLSYCESAQASASGTTLSALGVFSSVVATGTAASVSATTVPVVSTTVSDGSTIETTLGSSTISASAATASTSSSSTESSSGATSSSSPASSSAATTVPVVTTITSDGTTLESTVGSSTSFSSASSSAGAAPGPAAPVLLPLVGALRRSALVVAEVLGLGVLGIAGAFWGVGLVEAF